MLIVCLSKARMSCACIWGRRCFTAQSGYTALAALTNSKFFFLHIFHFHTCCTLSFAATDHYLVRTVLGTLIGAAIQVILLSDSARPLISMPPQANAPSLRTISRDPATFNDKGNNGSVSGSGKV